MQRGVGLLELLISLSVGLVITLAATQLYVSNHQSYLAQRAQGWTQENGSLALETLRDATRQAGYLGCATRTDHRYTVNNTLEPETDYRWALTHLIQGYESNGSQLRPASSLTLTTLAHTDVVNIRRLADDAERLTQSVQAGTDTLYFTAGANPFGSSKEQEVGLISDCTHGETFQVKKRQKDQVRLQKSLQANYTQNARAGPLINETYYVSRGISKLPVLARRYLTTVAGDGPVLRHEELVEGIENLQILYGEDSLNNDGIADRFVSADTDDLELNRVVSLRLAVVVVSAESIGAPAIDYEIFGQKIRPPRDGRLRKVFTTTVHLRNHTT